MMKRSFLPGVCENGGRVDEDVDDSPPDDDAVLSIDLGHPPRGDSVVAAVLVVSSDRLN